MYMIINIEGVLQKLDLSLYSIEELVRLQDEYHFEVINYSSSDCKVVM